MNAYGYVHVFVPTKKACILDLVTLGKGLYNRLNLLLSMINGGMQSNKAFVLILACKLRINTYCCDIFL